MASLIMSLGLIVIPIGAQWCVTCPLRGAIRSHYGIQGDSCSDCCISVFCDPCQAAQLYKEMQYRASYSTGQVIIAPGMVQQMPPTMGVQPASGVPTAVPVAPPPVQTAVPSSEYVQPDAPPGAVYMKNGMWLDKDDNPVGHGETSWDKPA